MSDESEFFSLKREVEQLAKEADGQQVFLAAIHSDFSVPMGTAELDASGRIWVRGRQPGGINVSVVWSAERFYLRLERPTQGTPVITKFIERSKTAESDEIKKVLQSGKS